MSTAGNSSNAQTRPLPKDEGRKARTISDQTFCLLLTSPAVLFVACIAVYPIIRVIWLSFYTQNLGTELEPRFSGASNYVRLINDGHYFSALRTTGLFTALAVSVELVMGMALALLLNETFRGRSIARAAALVPWALPTAVLALAWKWVFNDQYGVFNDLLQRFNLIDQPLAWLGKPATAMFSLIFADVWKTTPFMTILLLAGLQNIPNELYEAAQIDGVRSVSGFRLITLPLILPSIALALLFRTIQSFGIFDLPFVMTGGGPGGATETVAMYTYSTYLRYLDFGYGSAMLVGTTLVMAVIALVIYLPLSRLAAARSG